MTGILFILKRAFYFVVDNWRLFAILAGLLVLILLVVFAFRGCTKKDVKFNEQEIRQAQQAIAEQDRAKQIEILAASDAQEKVADDTIANADRNTVNAIHESKQKWNAASDEQIREELERRSREE